MRVARVASLYGAFSAVAVAGLAAHTASAEPIPKHIAMQAANMSVSPPSGPPGSGFTITFSSFGRNCPEIVFLWDDEELASLPGQVKGSVQVKVPDDAQPGTHVVTGRGCTGTAKENFVVTVDRTATVVSRTVTSPTTTPTGSSPPTSQRTTSGAATTGPATFTTGRGQLVFDKMAIQVGEPLSASGEGCDPNAFVTLTANGELVGATTADSSGAFTTPVQFTMIQPGRQAVAATCGGTVLTGGVELVLSSSDDGSTAILVVIVLVLLAGITLIAHYRTKTRW